MAVTDPVAEILERRRRLLVDGDLDGFADLFAPDGILELPFAQPRPVRIDGREAIRQFARSLPASLRIVDLRIKALHRTTAPGTSIVEADTIAVNPAGGDTVRLPCVQILTVHDGQIAALRDYTGPPQLPDAGASC